MGTGDVVPSALPPPGHPPHTRPGQRFEKGLGADSSSARGSGQSRGGLPAVASGVLGWICACCHSEPLCCGGRCMPRGVRDPRVWREQRGPAWACLELDAGSWAFAQLAGRGVLVRLVLGVPSLANSGRFQSPAVPCKSQVVGIVPRASRGHFLSLWVPPVCPAPH